MSSVRFGGLRLSTDVGVGTGATSILEIAAFDAGGSCGGLFDLPTSDSMDMLPSALQVAMGPRVVIKTCYDQLVASNVLGNDSQSAGPLTFAHDDAWMAPFSQDHANIAFHGQSKKYQFACSLSQVKVLGSVPGRACDSNNVLFNMRNLYGKGPRDLPVVFYAPVAPGCDWIGRLASGGRDVLVPSNALEVLWGAVAAC